jgi:cytochrome c oxidase subunit 3
MSVNSAPHGTTPYYYVPEPSRHPVMAAFGLFFVILGAGQWVNGVEPGASIPCSLGVAWCG